MGDDGESRRRRILVVIHTEQDDTVRMISAREADKRERERYEERSRKGNGMRRHYDFTGGVRGKYAERYAEGTNVVVLDPDVAQVFRDAESVNETLRAVVHILDL